MREIFKLRHFAKVHTSRAEKDLLAVAEKIFFIMHEIDPPRSFLLNALWRQPFDTNFHKSRLVKIVKRII